MGKCSCSGLNSDCFKCGGTGILTQDFHIDTSGLPKTNKGKIGKQKLIFAKKNVLNKIKPQKINARISNAPEISISDLLKKPSIYNRDIFIKKFNDLNEILKNVKNKENQIDIPKPETIHELKLQFNNIQIILLKKLHRSSPVSHFSDQKIVKGANSQKKKMNKYKNNKSKGNSNKPSNSSVNKKRVSKLDTAKVINAQPTIGDLINLGMVKPLRKK